MTNLIDLFLDQQNSESTKSTYKRGIDMFDTFLIEGVGPSLIAYHPEFVTDEDVVKWKKNLVASAQAERSQSSAWTGAKMYFTWLRDTGRILRSPFDGVKGPKIMQNRSPRIPTVEQVRKMLEAVKGRDQDEAVIRVLLNGLRIAEVVGLKINDILPIEDYKSFALRVVGKGNKERLVPLTEDAIMALHNWIKFRAGESADLRWPTVFQNGDGSPLTTRQVQEIVYRAAIHAERAGTPMGGISAHSLRHYYATWLIRSGASAFVVQQLLGHSSVKTTEVYVNLDMSDRLNVVKNYNPENPNNVSS